MPNIDTIAYGGWSQCYRVRNDAIELIVTAEVGPRIIRLGFQEEANLFCEVAEQMGKTGGDEWRIYGGHRFWHAPEENPRTYYPDNEPLIIEEHNGYLKTIQPTERTTGIQKNLLIQLFDDTNRVRVYHRLKNHNLWQITLAPWALSVMGAGGLGIVPFPPRGTHEEKLLPTNTLTMWAYTDLSDPRWTLGEKYILLRQDSDALTPQKIGVDVRDGWCAYVRDGFAFIKLFQKQEGHMYPDLGSTVEVFTNDFFLELETLGPLTRLQPDETIQYTEDWFLFQNVETPQTDADVDQYILPLVQQAKEQISE